MGNCLCQHCGGAFEAKRSTANFCSGRCRVAAWKERKTREAVEAAKRQWTEEAVRRLRGEESH